MITPLGHLPHSHHGATAPSGPGPPHYRGFSITFTPHSVYSWFTLGMPHLDEWSIWCRDLCLTKQNPQETDIHAPAGFEPAIPASGRLPYFVEITFNVCANIKHLSKYNRKNVTLAAKYNWHLCRFYSTEQTPSWRANNFSASQETPSFYGTRGLSPCLQNPATCLCHEPF